MPARKLLKRFSNSVSDLLNIHRKNDSAHHNKCERRLEQAISCGDVRMAKNLLESQVVWIDEKDSKGRTALHYAILHNNIGLVRMLLRQGADINAVDCTRTSAIHLACEEGMLDAMDLLLYYKGNVFAIDSNGRTPFDRACEYGRHKMVEMLLTSSFDLNLWQTSDHGHSASALHLAARNGHVQVCFRLIQFGWAINGVTKNGNALCEAVTHARIHVVRYLLFVGCDPSIKNQFGQSAIQLSKKASSRNSITSKEIRYFLNEHQNFVYGKAVRDFSGTAADELTFSAGDDIWIIDRNSRFSRWKAVIFGRNAYSRSGYISPSAVQIVDMPFTLMSMSSRLNPPCNRDSTINIRRIKKVSVPVVPDLKNMSPSHEWNGKYVTERPASNGAVCHERKSVFGFLTNTTCRNNQLNNSGSACNGNNGSLCQPNRINLPSTSIQAIDYVDRLMSTNLTMKPSAVASCSSLSHPTCGTEVAREQSTYSSHRHSEDYSSTECQRSSTGSSSSHGSSSGYESMKGSSVHSGSSGGAVGGVLSGYCNSSHLMNSSPISKPGGNSSGLLRGDSPQSRISLHSSGSSGGSSSLPSSSVDYIEDVTDNGSNGANLSNSPLFETNKIYEMMLKGIPEAEILALWLEKLGFSEYLSSFITQGYDLSTIARITPEDLLALGVTKPAHRKALISEIHKWHIQEPWPVVVLSNNLKDWLSLIGLAEYYNLFSQQGYYSASDVQKMNWEDFADIGIKKLGHLKRLALAIKKLKASFSAERYEDAIPPPPAPASSFQITNSLGCYKTWNHCARQYSPGKVVEVEVHKPTVQVLPNFRCKSSCGNNNELKKPSRNKSLLPYFDTQQDTQPIRLNLHSSSHILSEHPYANIDSLVGSTQASDMKIRDFDAIGTDEFEDYPPPPAPLVCEGSVRFLKSAIKSGPLSKSITECGAQNSGSSSSSIEQIPFANDNCGTIRSRDPASFFKSAPGISHPAASRRNINDVFMNDANVNVRPVIMNEHSNVLNDIGYMLQNLTDELDAMLVPGRGIQLPT